MAKKNSADANQDEAPEQIGKGRPTPKRKDAQAANAQPLIGARDKASVKADRAREAQAREKARLGMMQGDERFLTARDRGPQRRFVRDYVDARWNVGELLIPIMLIMLLASLVGPLAEISILVIWAFLAVAILDAILLGIRLRGLLTERFGEGKVQGGFRWYAAMRALQFRMLRVPKPQVKRGQYPHRQK